MAEQILNTRIQLKYDSYKNWVEKNPTLLSGEVAIAYLPPRTDVEHTNPAPAAVASATLIKVGPGAFNSLPWLSATAADVYSWAKAENKPAYTADEIEGLDTFIAGEIQDSNDNTTYAFAIVDGKLQVTETPHTLGVAGTPVVNSYDFVTPDELTTILASYYTKNEIDTLTNGKLHTQAQIESYIDTALANISDTDAIEGITTLVEYVNTHGADLAAITKEIYGDSGKVGDDPSRIDTAVSDASEALRIANGAADVANEAKEAALTAQNSASASATAASESAAAALASQNAAANSANTADAAKQAAETAKSGAVDAQGAAESARDLALGAKDTAVSAQGLAEGARDAAVAAQGKAEKAQEDAKSAQSKAEEAQAAAEEAKLGATTAQGKAEAAQAAAESARDAALDSNTSATAIANAAKEASEAATQAVAGLHKIATSGSAYDLAEVGTAKNSSNQDVPCLIFYCGTASELV